MQPWSNSDNQVADNGSNANARGMLPPNRVERVTPILPRPGPPPFLLPSPISHLSPNARLRFETRYNNVMSELFAANHPEIVRRRQSRILSTEQSGVNHHPEMMNLTADVIERNAYANVEKLTDQCLYEDLSKQYPALARCFSNETMRWSGNSVKNIGNHSSIPDGGNQMSPAAAKPLTGKHLNQEKGDNAEEHQPLSERHFKRQKLRAKSPNSTEAPKQVLSGTDSQARCKLVVRRQKQE